MAARSWGLDALNREYAEMLEHYRPRLSRYRDGKLHGRSALVERVRLVHDYRAFPHRDPDLPAQLLPEDWAGRAAHEVFLEAHELLRRPAESYVDEVLASRNGTVGGSAPVAH
jgi:phenylacetic acid degradation operon negative regulatory protein